MGFNSAFKELIKTPLQQQDNESFFDWWHGHTETKRIVRLDRPQGAKHVSYRMSRVAMQGPGRLRHCFTFCRSYARLTVGILILRAYYNKPQDPFQRSAIKTNCLLYIV